MGADEQESRTRTGQRLQVGPTVGDGPAATKPGQRAQTGLGRGQTPHVLWWSSSLGCSVGFCGAHNVLAGRRLAQGRHAEHLRRAAQTALAHPEANTALSAKADLLTAVDEDCRVQFENDASKVCETSPWAADKQVAEVIRSALVPRRGIWLL